MKNSAGRGECYPQRPKAEVDNTCRDLQNSSYYPTKAEFNNCFIIHSKLILSSLKLVNSTRSDSLFVEWHSLVPRFSQSMVQ